MSYMAGEEKVSILRVGRHSVPSAFMISLCFLNSDQKHEDFNWTCAPKKTPIDDWNIALSLTRIYFYNLYQFSNLYS